MLVHRPAVAAVPERRASVSWDETPCPLCGRGDVSLMLEGPDPGPSGGRGLWFAVVRCEHCGLAFTNPRPSPESISQFYPADYPPHRRASRTDTRPPRPVWSA